MKQHSKYKLALAVEIASLVLIWCLPLVDAFAPAALIAAFSIVLFLTPVFLFAYILVGATRPFVVLSGLFLFAHPLPVALFRFYFDAILLNRGYASLY